MSVYRFQPITWTASHAGRCPACGKRAVRSRTFEQTVNPFNRRPDGTPKSAKEVREDVRAEAEAWVPDFTHAGCAEAVAS